MRRSQSRWLTVFIVVAATMVVRLWAIHSFPEPDTDARGHLGIARALLSHPTSVAVHWVYLPAYHYVLAALESIGLGAIAIRVMNCVLAAVLPILVLRHGESTKHPAPVPTMAALLCAISPLVNLLGTSAQQETFFTLVVLGAVWAIDMGWHRTAGGLLAVAALVRYEAWGALALLLALQAAGRVPAIARRLPSARLPLVVTVPGVCAVFGWMLAHKLSDGQWLGFLRELYRYTHVQRDTFQRGWLWFPVEQPLFVFGKLVIVLFLVGLRSAWRPSHVIPLGIWLFLECAYLGKGALGSARYYESLVPFVALAAAHGVMVLGRRRRWVERSLFAIAFSQVFMLSARFCGWNTLARAVRSEVRSHAANRSARTEHQPKG